MIRRPATPDERRALQAAALEARRQRLAALAPRGAYRMLALDRDDAELLKLALANSPQFGERGYSLMMRLTALTLEADATPAPAPEPPSDPAPRGRQHV